MVGFGLIWHIWWLAIIGAIAAVVLVMIRTADDETEYILPAAEVAVLDAAHHKGKGQTI